MHIEIIGYFAGTATAIALMPQVFKAWKTRSTKDISIPWMLIYLTGLICWIIYGVGIFNFSIIVTTAIETLMALSLLILKLIHK